MIARVDVETYVNAAGWKAVAVFSVDTTGRRSLFSHAIYDPAQRLDFCRAHMGPADQPHDATRVVWFPLLRRCPACWCEDLTLSLPRNLATLAGEGR